MKYSTTIFMALAIFTILKVVQSTEFKVGGDRGWAVPPSNDTQFYNKWASHNRFKVNDTLHFVYKRQEEMVCVMHSKENHDKCNASYSDYYDDGDDIHVLNRPGYFYFISCILDNCVRGHLKMTVKVSEHDMIDSVANRTANKTSKSEATSVLKMDSDVLSQTLMIVGIIAMFTVFFISGNDDGSNTGYIL